MSRPSLASNDTAVQKNSDGSTDIYFGPKAPAGQGIQLGTDRSEAAVRTAVPPVRPEEGVLRQDLEAAGCPGSEVRKQKHEN